MTEQPTHPTRPTVLCVDDDRDVAEMIEAILVDEGYDVAFLSDLAETPCCDRGQRRAGRHPARQRQAPEFGESWESAASHRPAHAPGGGDHVHRPRPRHRGGAVRGKTDRARAARFAAVIPKPFHLDELLEAVATAAGGSQPIRSQLGRRRRGGRATW